MATWTQRGAHGLRFASRMGTSSRVGQKVSIEVAAGRPVRTQILPRAEAFEIPDLIRTKINLLPEGIQEVRTVEIVGLDLQADGSARSQHAGSRRDQGGGYKSKGAINKRLYIALPV